MWPATSKSLLLAFAATAGFAQLIPSGGGGGGGGCTTTGSAIQKANAGCFTAATVGDFPSISVLAADNSGSTTTYTAPGVPIPTTYANVAIFVLIPQTNGAGGAMTLNVAGLGPIALKDKDCSTNLGSTSLVAGQVYLFPYNGTVACLGASTATGTVGGTVTPTWTAGGTTTCAMASAALCKPTAANTGNTTLANTGLVSGATYAYIITNDPATTRTVTYPANMATAPAMPALLSGQLYFSCTYDGTNMNCGPGVLLNGTAGLIGPAPESAAPSTTLVPAGEFSVYGDSTRHVPCGIENGVSTPACMVLTGADVNPNNGQLSITTTTCTAPQMVTAISARGVGTCTAPIMTQNSQSAAYTTVLGDAGKMIYHPGADTSARTWTIDSNANVAYSIGTCITFVNDTSAGTLTIAITSDTLVLFPGGTTGSRTLTASNVATACKVTSTRWFISGSSGLT